MQITDYYLTLPAVEQKVPLLLIWDTMMLMWRYCDDQSIDKESFRTNLSVMI